MTTSPLPNRAEPTKVTLRRAHRLIRDCRAAHRFGATLGEPFPEDLAALARQTLDKGPTADQAREALLRLVPLANHLSLHGHLIHWQLSRVLNALGVATQVQEWPPMVIVVESALPAQAADPSPEARAFAPTS